MPKPKSRTPKSYADLDAQTARTPKARLDVHAAITEKIAAAIAAGAGTFEMPWHRPGVSFSLPKNAATDKTYRGSNILSLWIDADEKKFEHQVFATYKQWQELGAQVRGGEKGSLIVKYGEWVPKGGDASGHLKRQQGSQPKRNQDDDDQGKRLYAKPAWVFNLDQVDAPAELRARLVPAQQPRPDLTEWLARVDAFIAHIGIEVREGGQRAFYRHRDSRGEGDFIQMPPRNQFTGTATSTPTEAYYSTLLHEEIHGSGAEHRLNRQFGERFGDKNHAFEELVAELGAAFLCANLDVTNIPRIDHAQYCASWLEVLGGDTKAIFTAASLATRAVDYLFGLQPEPTPDAEVGHDGTLNAGETAGDTTRAMPDRTEDVSRQAASRTRGGPRP